MKTLDIDTLASLVAGIRPDDQAAVLAVLKSNGQIVIHNFGADRGREKIWKTITSAFVNRTSKWPCTVIGKGGVQ